MTPTIKGIQAEALKTFEAQVLAHLPVSLEIGGTARQQLKKWISFELPYLITQTAEAVRAETLKDEVTIRRQVSCPVQHQNIMSCQQCGWGAIKDTKV